MMANGIELPVLDITHPLFLSAIDETRLAGPQRSGAERREKGRKHSEYTSIY